MKNSKIWIAIALSLGTMAFFMISNIGEIQSSPFGAGDYYYTNLENYEKIFFDKEGINLGTDSPIFFAGFFVGWGVICWVFLKWIEEKR